MSCTPQVKTASEGFGGPERGKGPGHIVCGAEPTLGRLGNDAGLVNRRGLGKAKHVDMQNLWIQEASKVSRLGFVDEEGRHEREPSRFNDETAAET